MRSIRLLSLESTAVASNITTTTTTTTGTQTETPTPVLAVLTVKKLPSCYCFAADGGTQSFQAQIIDKSFLQ